MNITLQQIEYFIMASEMGSFSEAANQLFVSEPAVSKWINALEKALSVKLFTRSRNGVALTDEGRFLYAEWKPIYNKIYTTMQEVRHIHMHTYAENTFFIGCLTSFGCQEAFREVVKKFGEIFPWIELSTGIFEYAELKRRLLSGKIQLAIMTSFLLSGIQNISHKNIKKSELFIGLSTSHPLAAKEALRVSDLKDELFYHISPEIPVDSTVRGFEICVKSGFYPKHILRFPNLATLLDALEQGGGVVICDKIVDAEYERKIKLVPIDESDSAHYYSAVWRTIDFSGIIKNFVSLL